MDSMMDYRGCASKGAGSDYYDFSQIYSFTYIVFLGVYFALYRQLNAGFPQLIRVST